MSFTTGNSQTTNGNLALAVSRKENGNRFSFDACDRLREVEQARGRARPGHHDDDVRCIGSTAIRSPRPTTGRARPATIASSRPTTPATCLGQAAADRDRRQVVRGRRPGRLQPPADQERRPPARQRDRLRLLATSATCSSPMRTLDPVSIHSARALRRRDDEDVADAAAPARASRRLFNLNREGKALDARTGTAGRRRVPRHPRRRQAGPDHDACWPAERRLRLHAALRPEPAAAPDPDPGPRQGSAYAAGFQPFSDKTDTLAEATLIYTFI